MHNSLLHLAVCVLGGVASCTVRVKFAQAVPADTISTGCPIKVPLQRLPGKEEQPAAGGNDGAFGIVGHL